MGKIKKETLKLFENGMKELSELKTVSLIIPIRNPSKDELVRTINSINDLKNKNFELVLVFDGNEIGQNLPEDIPTISNEIDVQIITLDQVSGPSVARNVGVFSSKGEIITYLDIGDEINSNKIEHLRDVFEYIRGLALLFSSYSVNHPSAGIQFFDSNKMFKRALKGKGKGGRLLLKSNIRFPATSVSHVRIPFYMTGGFQPNIKSGEEEVLWRRMIELIPDEFVAADDFNSGIKHFQDYEKKEYSNFEINVNHNKGSNGQYLDDMWFENLHNKGFVQDEEN